MKKALDIIKKSLESPWAMVAICFLTVLFYCLEIKYFQYCVYSLVFILLIITKAKWYIAPLNLIMVLASSRFNGDFSYFNLQSVGFIFDLIFGVILFGFLGYDLVINFKDYLNSFKKNWLLYSLLFMLASMIISLVYSPVINLSLMCILGQILTIYIMMIIPLKIDFDEMGKKMMMFSFILTTWVIGFECLFVFFNVYFIEKIGIYEIMNQKLLNLGWAISNRYAVICNIGFLGCLYWYVNYPNLKNRLFALASALFAILIIVLSACRAAYLGLLVIIPLIVAFYICYYLKLDDRRKEKKYLLSILSAFALVIVIGFCCGFFQDIFQSVKDYGFSLNGRDAVWHTAINAFHRHPLIGCGPLSGSYYINLEAGRDYVNNYHNYFLDALATTGVIGLLAFLFFMYVLIHRCLIKNSSYAIILSILIVYFLVNGFVDSLFLNYQLMPIMLMPYALLPDNGILKVKNQSFEKNEEMAMVD